MSYFNDEQLGHLRFLDSLKPEEKCDCGWSKRGECFGQCWGDESKGGAKPRLTGDSLQSSP